MDLNSTDDFGTKFELPPVPQLTGMRNFKEWKNKSQMQFAWHSLAEFIRDNPPRRSSAQATNKER